MEMTFLSTRELEHKYQEFPFFLVSLFSLALEVAPFNETCLHRWQSRGKGGQGELQPPAPNKHFGGAQLPHVLVL